MNISTNGADYPEAEGKLLKINEDKVKSYLDKVVKGSIDETLNSLLDAEADELCQASKCERLPDRQNARAGHYTRTFHARAGELKLRIPKLRSLPFETSIIERCRRREVSVEEALVEMYMAGVSVHRIEDVT